MKVFLSSDGIEEAIKYTVSDVQGNINNARSKISSCPTNFSYYSFVSNLSDDLSKINKRLDKLLQVASRTDREYFNDVSYSKERYNNIDEPNFVEREGFRKLNVNLSTSGTHTTVKKKTMDSRDIVIGEDIEGIVDVNSSRGKYQSIENFGTTKQYSNIDSVDSNATRGKYQSTENFSTTKQYSNIEGVDSNATRGKYQN